MKRTIRPSSNTAACPMPGPFIPAASLRGLARARARRILATIAYYHKVAALSPKHAGEVADSLLGSLFGTSGQRSALWFSEAVSETPGSPHPQFFNAVDRFTGGVAKKKLYNVSAVLSRELRFTVSIDALSERRLREEDWWKGLLVLLLRDAMEGDLAIGWGKSRGYGAFRLKLTAESGAEIDSWAACLRELRCRLRGGATRPVQAGSVHEYFRPIDRDLLPWKTPDRSHLTPAELLFGVVDERGDDSGEDSTAPFHLASRVRFSDALPHPDRPPVVGTEVMLKVLASPKGRYPGMYFHPRDADDTFIPKNRFYRTSGRHNAWSLPNGRKVYLHHQREDVAAGRWVTVDQRGNAEQKLRCKPIRNERYGESDSDLYFHLDFENLSNREVTLLVASLRPSPEFRHRLGLGKPLGLGTVEVAVEGVFLIDRVARYTKKDLLDAPRYHQVWRTAPRVTEYPWAWHYPGEAERLSQVSAPALDTSPFPNFWEPNLIDDETLAIVKALGDPALVQAPVHTPTVDGYRPEQRTFEWFVQNETAVGRQALPKVDPGSPLTVLRSYARPASRSGGGRSQR